MPVSINRRAFVGMAAALVATAAGTKGAVAAERPEFGYSLDGELYQTGFASGDAAAAAAKASRSSGTFQVARIVHHGMVLPSEAGEMVVDQLINDRTIGGGIVDWLSCANEEGDYEGDFADACSRAHRGDRSVLDGQGRIAVAAALTRAGDGAAGGRVLRGEDVGELSDAVYEAVSADAILEDEMGRIVRAFAESNDLAREIRGLEVHDVVSYQHAVAA